MSPASCMHESLFLPVESRYWIYALERVYEEYYQHFKANQVKSGVLLTKTMKQNLDDDEELDSKVNNTKMRPQLCSEK